MKFLAIGLILSVILVGYVCFLFGVGFGRHHPAQSRVCRIHIVVDAYSRPHEGIGVDIRPWEVACRDLPEPTR